MKRSVLLVDVYLVDDGVLGLPALPCPLHRTRPVVLGLLYRQNTVAFVHPLLQHSPDLLGRQHLLGQVVAMLLRLGPYLVIHEDSVALGTDALVGDGQIGTIGAHSTQRLLG